MKRVPSLASHLALGITNRTNKIQGLAIGMPEAAARMGLTLYRKAYFLRAATGNLGDCLCV